MARRNRVEYSIEAIDNASTTVNRVTATFNRLFAIVAAGLSVREVAEYADSWTIVSNRIDLVTESAAELQAVQEELLTLANETRSDLQSTADLYGRVARASGELGLSQRDLIEFTRTVSQAIRISGATAQEASAGLVQLGQALASGALRGDELRSILEQMPRLARAIADGLGVTIGELRELGSEGELTAERVIQAIQSSAPGISEEFEKVTPTIAEAFTILQNGVTDFIGSLNQFTGAGGRTVELLSDIGEGLSDLADALTGNLESTDELSTGMQILATSLIVATQAVFLLAKGIKDVLSLTFEALGNQIGGLAAALAQLFEGNFDTALEIFKDIPNEFDRIVVGGLQDLNEGMIEDTAETVERIAQIWNTGLRDAAPSIDLDIDTIDIEALLTRARRGLRDYMKEQEAVNRAVMNFNREWERARRVDEIVESVKQSSDELEDFIKNTEDAARDVGREMERLGLQFASAFEDAVVEGGNLREVLQGLFQDIVRISTRKLIVEPLGGSFADLLGGFSLFGRQSGGTAGPNQSVRVHDGEIVTFGPSGGRVTSAAAQRTQEGNVNFSPVTNITLQGGDQDTVRQLQIALDQRDRRLMLQVQRFVKTGYVPL